MNLYNLGTTSRIESENLSPLPMLFLGFSTNVSSRLVYRETLRNRRMKYYRLDYGSHLSLPSC